MEPESTDFEQQPATKRDVADVRKDLTKLEHTLTKEIEKGKDELREEIKEGFENMEKLLSAPNTGLIPRVKRLEETVGIRPGE